MPYLIDGHNLIPKIPGLNLNSLDDEIQLIKRLQVFCQQKQKRAEVYFDNAPPGQATSQMYGPVTAHFVRQGITADTFIMKKLSTLGRAARNWIVVTSDRTIQAEARSYHAKVIPSDQFANEMLETHETDGDDPGMNSDVSLNKSEIHDWLKIFGSSGEDQMIAE